MRIRHDEVSVAVKRATPKPQQHPAFVTSQFLGIRNLTAASWMLWLGVCDEAAVTQRFTGRRQVVSVPPQAGLSGDVLTTQQTVSPERQRETQTTQESIQEGAPISDSLCSEVTHHGGRGLDEGGDGRRQGSPGCLQGLCLLNGDIQYQC